MEPVADRIFSRVLLRLIRAVFRLINGAARKGRIPNMDRNDSLRIAHAADCPVAQPGFRVIEGVTQCTCDFGRRMGEHLLETMPDAYERRADGSVGLRGRRGEDS